MPTVTLSDAVRRNAFAFVALATMALPTMVTLAQRDWGRDFGAYGPIVLVTGAWLLWRRLPEIRRDAEPGPMWVSLLILAPCLPLYVFGRAYDFPTFETAAVYGAGLSILQSRVGWRVMLREWFPLLYLAFVIPPPNQLLAEATGPLKDFVSHFSTDWLANFGIPVSREGVTIFVAQYQLLVEDACSGMNSLVGLIAVSLLYIYLMRGSNLVYSLALLVFVIPIAIVANIMRIMVLILLTYFFGNEVAQGFLHFTAGLLLFATAILFVFGIDQLIDVARRRFFDRQRPA
jgi:exosortase